MGDFKGKHLSAARCLRKIYLSLWPAKRNQAQSDIFFLFVSHLSFWIYGLIVMVSLQYFRLQTKLQTEFRSVQWERVQLTDQDEGGCFGLQDSRTKNPKSDMTWRTVHLSDNCLRVSVYEWNLWRDFFFPLQWHKWFEYKSQLAFINTKWSLSYPFRGCLRYCSRSIQHFLGVCPWCFP